MHKSVGAIIKNKKGEFLMIDRAIFPFGWACPAGHIKDESPKDAMKREVREEVGLEIEDACLLAHEFIAWNECSKGVRGHDWFLFEVLDWQGEVKISEREAREYIWADPKRIGTLKLEKVWRYWFEKMKII